MNTAAVCLAALCLTACAGLDQGSASHDSVVFDLADVGLPPNARPETLYAISAGKDGVRLRVSSNGCTTKEHIKVIVTPRLPDHPPYNKLLVFRVMPDRCQSLVMASAWVEFSYEELGLKPTDRVGLDTLLTPWTGPVE